RAGQRRKGAGECRDNFGHPVQAYRRRLCRTGSAVSLRLVGCHRLLNLWPRRPHQLDDPGCLTGQGGSRAERAIDSLTARFTLHGLAVDRILGLPDESVATLTRVEVEALVAALSRNH